MREQPVRTICRSLIVTLLTVACSRPDTAVSVFDSHIKATSDALVSAAAATYIYRMAETPEEQVMQKAMELLRQRRASSADLQAALAAERQRRTKYIDDGDASLEQARNVVVEQSRNANAIRDDETRTAARKIVAHHEEQLRLCSTILRAQRTRSSFTEDFLQAAIDGRRISTNDQLAKADGESERARARLEELLNSEGLLVAEFRGIKDRRSHSSFW
jgi:hypothetical protein